MRRLPHVQRTLREGDIGYEAARIVAHVAAPETDAAWAERAKRRTVVHLREDVRAAEFLSRTERREFVEPPSVEAVTKVRALETAVVTGALFDGPEKARDAKTAVASLWAEFAEARRAPSQVRSRARDTVRLRVRPEIRAQYRGVERLYARHLPRPMSFSSSRASRSSRRGCASRRRSPTATATREMDSAARIPRARAAIARPAPLRFGKHGGSDEPANLTTLCVLCHLEGVHGGRISVMGQSPHLEWRLGDHTVVIGRERHRVQ